MSSRVMKEDKGTPVKYIKKVAAEKPKASAASASGKGMNPKETIGVANPCLPATIEE